MLHQQLIHITEIQRLLCLWFRREAVDPREGLYRKFLVTC
jgi:hypothetical protein